MTTNSTKKSIYISVDDMKTWQDLTENAKKANMGTGVFICWMWEEQKDKNKFKACDYCNVNYETCTDDFCDGFVSIFTKKYGPKNIEFTDINTKTFHIPVAMADTWEEIEKAAKLARRGVGFFICEKWVEWTGKK